MAILSLVGLAEIALAGSPFYLTVERTYSDTERPIVRLDYSNTSEPMLFRILRPIDTERFLEGQLQISRSYEEPQTALNPGHYLLKGANYLNSPLAELRDALNSKFRTELKAGAFGKLLPPQVSSKLTSVPNELVHNAPAGFTTIHEFHVDLTFGGSGARDLGWWFADSTWDEYTYRLRQIELDTLTDGLYLVQAVQGNNEAQALLQVSGLSMQVQQSIEQLIVRVIDRRGNAVSNAEISIRDGRGKWFVLPSRTNEFGESRYDSKEGALDGKLIVRAETSEKRQVFTSTDFLPVSSPTNSVYISTDRPIFKPGEEFFFKGAIRTMDKGQLVIPPFVNKEAKLSVFRSSGENTELSSSAYLTSFGTFSGKLSLDQSQDPGLYRLIAEVDGKAYSGEFRVRDYIKPTFYLSMIEHSPVIVPGQTFDLHFRAKRYSGVIPRGVKYEVYVYRKRFEIAPFVAESGNDLQAGHDYYGDIRSASALTQPERVYSSVEDRISNNELKAGTNSWSSALALDENGEGRATLNIPKMSYDPKKDEWIYTVLIKAIDQAGSQAVLSENIYMTLSEAVAAVSFSKSVATIGERNLQAVIRSSFPDGSPAAGCDGNLLVELVTPGKAPEKFVQAAFKTDAQGLSYANLPAVDRAAKLQATAELVSLSDRRLSRISTSQTAEMIVGGSKGEAISNNQELELFAASTILSPGETTKILALLPEKWGENNWGTLWETIAGDKIFATKTWAAKGRSYWLEVEAKKEYGTGFFDTLSVPVAPGKYKEKTLAFRIIPWDKRLHIAIHPEKPFAEPSKPFGIKLAVKDAQGRAASETELVVSIVDRAVYAVQPEFRPGIFDFFFPIPRLNVSTFYSDNLQGYGYADLLRKPNFALSALKSQSKPAKRTVRDTAGWFPHLVTNDEGEAELSVDLPANLTQWVVTVLAVDKAGRIGDARDQFQSRVDIGTDAVMPQFLRAGDKASGFLRLQNDTAQEVEASLAITADPGVQLSAPTSAEPLKLPPNGELKKSFEIIAKDSAGLQTLGVSLTITPPASTAVGGPQAFDIDLKPDTVTKTISAQRKNSNSLEFTLPENTQVSKLTVHVVSGVLGAALGALPQLLSYPYGCTEQLAHSTIPNLVLINVLKDAGISDSELGPLAEVAKRARKNAENGINKLLLNMRSDGGFALWPSDTRSECTPTLIALSALKYASELGFRRADGASYQASSWVNQNMNSCQPKNYNAVSIYSLARMAEVQSYSLPVEVPLDFIKSRLESNQSFRLDELLSAYEIISAYEQVSWHGFNQALADFAKEKGLDPKAVILTKIAEQVGLFEPSKYIQAVRSDFSELGFSFGPAQVEARAINILLANGRLTTALREKLTTLLLAQYDRGMWFSTYDTAQVIFQARGLIAEEAKHWKENQSSTRVSVLRKDGSTVGELKATPGGFFAEFSQPEILQNLNPLHIDGIAAPFLSYGYAEIKEKSRGYSPSESGLHVTRTMLKISPSGTKKLDGTEVLSVGDLVISEVMVSRAENQTSNRIASEFVIIEDPTPSLAESEENESQALADAKLSAELATFFSQVKDTKRYPEKVTRVLRLVPPGVTRVYQVWRVNFQGQATVPPAVAFDMYDQRLNGSSRSWELSVN